MSSRASDVPRFDREFFGAEDNFTRIGNGALGGKASGLMRVREEILSKLDSDQFPYIEVAVPTATVLTTEVFDKFIERNALHEIANSDLSDDRIAHAFQKAELPAEHVGDLRGLISNVHTPLAVRSSSLLEDDLDHPFAGVYGTKMIPNNEIEEDARFSRLDEAIKFVFATTFFAESKSYLASLGSPPGGEKMAVIIQEVVGQRAGDRYYPCVSGVARSHNYYPTGHARPEDGVVTLALGLGKTIVDGGLSWSYSPAFPKAPPPFNDLGELLKNTQTSYWAVHMGDPPPHDPIRETEYLVQPGLAEAEADGALRYLVSTYDSGSDRLNPGLDIHGPRALTFAPLLGSRLLPFNDLLKRLLEISEDALGTPVEIEFAINLERRDALPARVGFLQVRPMMVGSDKIGVSERDLFADDVVLASETVLGNGERTDIEDVVFIRPDAFEPAKTPAIAKELEGINRSLVDDGRRYLLIGFGRWGTSDPWLGIPVAWGQISGARVIVEATLPDVQPDLSQGSHFFHNLLSFHVLYISVEHYGPHRIDWEWLGRQPAVQSTDHLTHVRLPEPLEIRVDGASGRGVIRRHA
ncbi:MAG: hypothetical protein IFK92_13755 [Acidobacteria bacterium]|nr:hypothetical protein [Candidatus Sulfomarinibacter kjeldsenii]